MNIAFVNKYNINTNRMFVNKEPTSVDFGKNLDWSNGRQAFSINTWAMNKLTEIRNIETAHIEDAYSMFFKQKALRGEAYVPASVSNAAAMYDGCTVLPSANWPTKLERSSIGNWCGAFMACPNLKNIPDSLPYGVVDLRQGFYNCTNLTKVPTIPETVVNFFSAFRHTGVESVPTIPASVTNMFASFAECNNLTKVPATLPNSVINCCGVFSTCPNLTKVSNIPANARDVSWYIESCSKVTEDIYVYSSSVEDATEFAVGTTAAKNVYIPFKYENGANTKTYNAFTNAGYKEDGSLNGVYLKDLNSK